MATQIDSHHIGLRLTKKAVARALRRSKRLCVRYLDDKRVVVEVLQKKQDPTWPEAQEIEKE